MNDSKLPPISPKQMNLWTLLEYEKTWNLLSKGKTLWLTHDTPLIWKQRDKILPDIESEVSMESIDYIEQNKRQVKMLSIWPLSP